MRSLPPALVIDDATSVDEEAVPYRDLSDAQRARVLAAVCRAAARILRSRPDRDAVIEYVDPLPSSTIAALDRLRRRRDTER